MINIEKINTLRNEIKELKENLNKSMALGSTNNKFDIKEEMNKIIKLDHDCNKIALNLIIVSIKDRTP